MTTYEILITFLIRLMVKNEAGHVEKYLLFTNFLLIDIQMVHPIQAINLNQHPSYGCFKAYICQNYEQLCRDLVAMCGIYVH